MKVFLFNDSINTSDSHVGKKPCLLQNPQTYYYKLVKINIDIMNFGYSVVNSLVLKNLPWVWLYQILNFFVFQFKLNYFFTLFSYSTFLTSRTYDKSSCLLTI